MRDSQEDPIGITAAEVAAIARTGAWDSTGAVRPAAVKLAEALTDAVRAGDRGGLPDDLGALLEQTLGLATPGFPRITMSDGVKLSAHTLTQLAPGPHPVVIVPAGWNPVGWPLFEYAYLMLALKGYHVLAYTPRGMGQTFPVPGGGYLDGPFTSGGTIDIGGPRDWADGSTVIDYAVEQFAPSRVGFLGESYGSGISQLVAAHDDRVAVVVALSTWGNLATSLYDHNTRHLKAVEALLGLTGGPLERKFDAATMKILHDFLTNQNMNDVVAWGTVRAPESYAARTNAHGVPTFCSNTWHEGLFPVNQVLTTFNLLTVPKRLNMWIGDHTAPEGSALVGPPATPGEVNEPMREAYAWLDHYLNDTRNGVEDWDQVSNQVMFTYTTIPVTDPETGEPTGENKITVPARRELSATWDEVSTGTERLGLTGERGADGELAESLEPGWSRGFIAGVETEATAMDGIIVTGQAEWSGNPKIYDTSTIDRRYALVWSTSPLPGPDARRIRGAPRLRLTVRSTAGSVTMVAYLFDVDQDETAKIITHEPFTLDDLTPNQDVTVSWQLQAAAYDVPANHRLMLVIDSEDRLYANASVPDSQITISSPGSDPSYLDLPTG